jgi:hypothetical protein
MRNSRDGHIRMQFSGEKVVARQTRSAAEIAWRGTQGLARRASQRAFHLSVSIAPPAWRKAAIAEWAWETGAGEDQMLCQRVSE